MASFEAASSSQVAWAVLDERASSRLTQIITVTYRPLNARFLDVYSGMVKMSVVYEGQLHCNLVHEPSHSEIATDAPKDNQGRGEKFSPTDLVGAALASCVLTTIAIVAERDGVSVKGARAEVQKEMNPKPRRIRSLHTKITLPAAVPLEYRQKLEQVALHCPVHASLHPDVDAGLTFEYV